MGKSSRRNNRNSKSKTERKNNFKAAKKNHLYNQSVCKSTAKIIRASVSNKSFQSSQQSLPTSKASGRQSYRYTDVDVEGDSLFNALFRE